MKSQKLITVLAGAAALALLGGSAGQTAVADTEPVEQSVITLAAQAMAADTAGYIIVGPEDGEFVDGATFYPTGPIADDTLVVIADEDGSLPNGLTESTLQEAVAASRAGTATQMTVNDNETALRASEFAWSATSASFSRPFNGSSLIGLNDSVRAGYYFYTAIGFAQNAAGNGLGFYRGYNGSQFGTWEKFYGVGNAGSTGGGGSVPWGNVAATKKFMTRCSNVSVCWGNFS